MQMPYKNIIRVVVLFIFMAQGYSSRAQEICNNGIDDDADNLIDLHDPDCQCHFKVKDNLLLNGSFELYNHCPVNATYTGNYNIANNWQYGSYTYTNEASFYHNLSCAYDSGLVVLSMPPALPLPDGNGFIGIINSTYISPVPEKTITKSYVGQCLQTALKKGEDYTLGFYGGRFRSWDNLTGKIYPFTVAVFGNADCNAVPFGAVNAFGSGCPANYPGWVLLGKTTVYGSGAWVQDKIKLTIPADINVIEVGVDCSVLAPINDLTDSTTFLDYHLYYLDDLHLLPTKDFPFEYIHLYAGSSCNGLLVLEAPVANASYQWYKDSIAIAGATNKIYTVPAVTGTHFYNVLISTDTGCVITEPFPVTASRLNEVHIPADTLICSNNNIVLAPPLDGITYTVNGEPNNIVTVDKEGHYIIVATDVYGCKKTFAANVIKQNCTGCTAYIPTAFTPNNDRLNDFFRPIIQCGFSDFRMRIYNRWSQKIFETTNSNEGWNGTYTGSKAAFGTYIYVITYKSITGITKSLRGTVVLLL